MLCRSTSKSPLPPKHNQPTTDIRIMPLNPGVLRPFADRRHALDGANQQAQYKEGTVSQASHEDILPCAAGRLRAAVANKKARSPTGERAFLTIYKEWLRVR